MNTITPRLGVCSWSLQPETPEDLLAKVRQTGLRRILLALDPLREQPSVWNSIEELARQQGVELVSGMLTCVGEDYSTLESIRRTGGVVPDHTWEENWKNFQIGAEIAARLKFKLVMFHAGFLPHDEKDPAFGKLLERLRKIAQMFAKHGLEVAFETGQETAGALLAFLKRLACPNVGVNFDPANMILYNNGNPIEALRLLGPHVKQCHLKDAKVTKVPGTWGEEVVLGTGEVNWPEFFNTLKAIGFNGNLFIEREAGNQRVADVRAAREYVEKMNI
jgi:sugar phosphate isomerase/epimerase